MEHEQDSIGILPFENNPERLSQQNTTQKLDLIEHIVPNSTILIIDGIKCPDRIFKENC